MSNNMQSFAGLLVLVLATQTAPAQDSKPAAPLAPALDEVLRKWEMATLNLNSVHAAVARTTLRKIFQTLEKDEGTIKVLRCDGADRRCLASLKLCKKGKPEDFQQLLWAEDKIYSWNSSAKEIRSTKRSLVEAPPVSFADMLYLGVPLGQVLPSFLNMGLEQGKDNLEQVKKRFDIILLPPPNKHYHYLRFVPRSKIDEKHFKEVRVALNASNFLPRQIWILLPNDDETTWDYPRIKTNEEMGKQDFAPPEPPAGWTLREAGK